MIKLIATDMDGTLLNDKKEIPAGFESAVRELYRHGVRFALASGREYKSIVRSFAGYEDLLLVIANNGSACYDGGRRIAENLLTPDEIRPIYEAIAALPDVDIVISCENTSYTAKTQRTGMIRELARLVGSEENARRLFRMSGDPLKDAASDRIGKLAFFHDHDAWTACEKTLAPFAGSFQYFPSEMAWVNLMKKGVDKGSGVRQIQQYLGISPDECMVFGDYLNDISMFHAAAHSYAMGNAHPDLKAVAAHVAPTNNEEGVMQILKQVFPYL